MPVYELANQYGWVVLFHTGIVLRAKFDEAEDVASYRMRAFHLEEIARRFPKITALGAHCGNPEYEWAAEVTRWNPNVFFDLSGTTLTKMRDRLGDFKKIFWWSGEEWDSERICQTGVRLPTPLSTGSRAYCVSIELCSKPAAFRNRRRT